MISKLKNATNKLGNLIHSTILKILLTKYNSLETEDSKPQNIDIITVTIRILLSLGCGVNAPRLVEVFRLGSWVRS